MPVRRKYKPLKIPKNYVSVSLYEAVTIRETIIGSTMLLLL